jgi:molecular chaperone DnaK
MARVVGIDLGTTFSAVAVVKSGGTPELLWNRDGESLTPSVVMFQEGEAALVGSMAKRSVAVMPDDCAQFVKRQMGDPHWIFTDSRGTEYRPEQISAVILRRLVEDAAMALDGQEIRDVVITVPAYFDDTRRKATQDAGQIAGLNVLRLINEPTAAAIAYGLDHEQDDTRLFVLDLGGGTFDVTIMRLGDGKFDVIATDGDRNLGGFDFDNALMKHVASTVVDQGGPDLLDGGSAEADLREKCEMAKRTLSQMAQAAIFVTADGKNFTIKVTRAAFEQMTADLLSRTEDLSEAVLEEAGLAWTDIDKVLLVGGSTRMPMVREMITKLSGIQPETGTNPDEVVALGAAIVAEKAAADTYGGASLTRRVTISDVTSQSLGTLILDRKRNDLEINDVIISRNSKIPCKQVKEYGTVEHHQQRLNFTVTEGDDEDPQYVTHLLERPIDLPPGLPEDAPLRVTMSYDIDGVVHVEIFDLTNNKTLGEIELDRPYNLDRSEVESMSKAMRELEVQ